MGYDVKMTGVKLEKIVDIGMYLFIEKGLRGGISYIAKRYAKANNNGFDVNSVSEKSPIGYILEVDLQYPDELHVLHNDYPLAPEKLAISYEMLSDYCNEIADKYEIKVGDVKKLIPNLGSKTNYVLHYKNLQLYLPLGMKLTKIRRVLIFKQSDWMKKYIDFTK